MTALNGVVQPDAVFLLTDGAIYDGAGLVVEFGSKVFVIATAGMAIGWSGFGSAPRFEAHLRDHHASLAHQVMATLPQIVSDMARENVDPEGSHRAVPGRAGVRLLVALWDRQADEPQLWAIHSDQVILGAAYAPCTLVRLHQTVELAPGAESVVFGRPVDFADPASFDPATDGLKLLEAQRHEPWETEAGPQYFVGGFAQLTTVSRGRIETREIRRWPDRIGQLIDPGATPRASSQSNAPAGSKFLSVASKAHLWRRFINHLVEHAEL